ncbi:MAG: hypothetical protein EHM89_00300 [Acidobacteria bacterium]|nr:MAG: hypothetical protein EHM89_00300 [Acidobacteriota bacterium]
MSHGRDCPARCSLCLGATPRVVSQVNGEVTIDGVPVRPIEPAPENPYGKIPRRTPAHVQRARRAR